MQASTSVHNVHKTSETRTRLFVPWARHKNVYIGGNLHIKTHTKYTHQRSSEINKLQTNTQSCNILSSQTKLDPAYHLRTTLHNYANGQDCYTLYCLVALGTHGACNKAQAQLCIVSPVLAWRCLDNARREQCASWQKSLSQRSGSPLGVYFDHSWGGKSFRLKFPQLARPQGGLDNCFQNTPFCLGRF